MRTRLIVPAARACHRVGRFAVVAVVAAAPVGLGQLSWAASTSPGVSGLRCPVGELHGSRCVEVFRFTGGPQHFSVPAGVDEVEVAMKGGDGGGVLPGDSLQGGGEAEPSWSSLPVAPGDRFTVIVGGEGRVGVVPGEPGGTVDVPGAYGGGGASCATTVAWSDGSLQLVSGGSGGGGSFLFHADGDRALVVASGGGGGIGAGLAPEGGQSGFPGSPGDASDGGRIGSGATSTSPGRAWVDNLAVDDRWRYVMGRAGSGPVALEAGGQLSGMVGGAGLCGGSYYTQETAAGIGMGFYATGGGGGGIYAGGSGGSINQNRHPVLPIHMRTYGGGGGSGIVVEGEPIVEPPPSSLPLDSADGEVHLSYEPLPVAPTTTSSTPSTTSSTSSTTTVASTTSTTTTLATASSTTTAAPVIGQAAPTAPEAGPHELARTGSDGTLGGVGALLVLAGAGVIALRRRLVSGG